MKANNIKYPGILGKRPTRKELDTARDAALINVPLDDLSANRIAAREYEQERTVTLLVDLLDHYEIPEDDKNKWFSLALRLARQHVPAFQEPISAGRKRKKPFGSLADILSQYPKAQKKKVGRPKKWPVDMYRQLLQGVKSTCDKEGLKGRGSKKRALEILTKRAPIGRRQSLVKWWQKRYSEAVRMFPELVQ